MGMVYIKDIQVLTQYKEKYKWINKHMSMQ